MSSRVRNGRWLAELPIAHRGLHDPTAPENGETAFRRAADTGWAIELDVRLTSDDRLVVFHDARTGRMCGEDVAIARTPHAALAALRLAGTDDRIPRLEDVLAFARARAPLLVEIKDRAAAAPAARLLARAGVEAALQSFDPGVVRRVRRLAPSAIPCGQLFPPTGPLPAGGGSFDFAALPLPLLKPGRLARLRARDATVLAWTISKPEDMRRVESLRVNPIFEGCEPRRPARCQRRT